MAKKEVESKLTMKIVGVVEFYGKVDTYAKKNGKLKEGDPEKEFSLCIKDFEIRNLDPETIRGWYTNDRGKVELPADYEDLLDGKRPEKMYFKSQYPIDTFQILEDGNVVDKKIDYSPDLNGCRISMTLNRKYIGRIAIAELPPKYTPIAFDASEFDEL